MSEIIIVLHSGYGQTTRITEMIPGDLANASAFGDRIAEVMKLCEGRTR